MAARITLEDKVKRVQALRDEPDLAVVRTCLRQSLGDSSNLVIGAAARMIAEMELGGFEAELLAAWERCLVDAVDTDKGCRAKGPIVEALSRTGFDDADFWLAGIRYRQIEPQWPHAADTAFEVRGGCAFGLARSRMLGPVRKLTCLVDLLHSSEEVDRVHAARAIADTASDSAIPLLKSTLLGSDQAAVMGACLAGLLTLAASEFLPLVVTYLDHEADALHAEASAALGESRLPGAIEALIAAARRERDASRVETLLQSLGLSRASTAIDFLISRVAADGSDALTAFQALRPACVHPDTRQRVFDAAKGTKNVKLQAAAKALR